VFILTNMSEYFIQCLPVHIPNYFKHHINYKLMQHH